MALQDLINSRLGVATALAIGRIFPPRLGYRLAVYAADRVAARKDQLMVQAVRANQWVVSGGTLTSSELEARTRATFRNTAHCLFDLYHNIDRPDRILALSRMPPAFQELIDSVNNGARGTLFVCPHMSNFELIGRVLALSGLKFLVLSYPQPPKGYQWQNELRRRVGLEILPMSVTALRAGIERLQAGGAVLTGVDRPLGDSNYRPHFFGRRANVPVGHVRMALKAQVPVVVVSALMEPDGKYTLLHSDPIEMRPHKDRETEILQNAEPILDVVAGFIRLAPEQWSMTYPVWPEAMPEVLHPDR